MSLGEAVGWGGSRACSPALLPLLPSRGCGGGTRGGRQRALRRERWTVHASRAHSPVTTRASWTSVLAAGPAPPTVSLSLRTEATCRPHPGPSHGPERAAFPSSPSGPAPPGPPADGTPRVSRSSRLVPGVLSADPGAGVPSPWAVGTGWMPGHGPAGSCPSPCQRAGSGPGAQAGQWPEGPLRETGCQGPRFSTG